MEASSFHHVSLSLPFYGGQVHSQANMDSPAGLASSLQTRTCGGIRWPRAVFTSLVLKLYLTTRGQRRSYRAKVSTVGLFSCWLGDAQALSSTAAAGCRQRNPTRVKCVYSSISELFDAVVSCRLVADDAGDASLRTKLFTVLAQTENITWWRWTQTHLCY